MEYRSIRQDAGNLRPHQKEAKEKILAADPKKPLERGYALVQMGGTVVRSKTQLKKDDRLTLCLADGEVTATVEKII